METKTHARRRRIIVVEGKPAPAPEIEPWELELIRAAILAALDVPSAESRDGR